MARSTGRPRPRPPRPPRPVGAAQSAERHREVSPLHSPAQVGGRSGSLGASVAGRGPGLPPQLWAARSSPQGECRPRPTPRGPRPARRPPSTPRACSPGPAPHGAGRAPVTCRAPGGLLLPPRHAARAAAAVASAAAGVRGARGRGAPGAGATPRRAQLWPRPRGLRAPGAPRTAGRRSHGRPCPGPLRRRRRRPREPRPGRRAAGEARGAWAPSPESSPARAAGAAAGARRAGPRPALHAAASPPPRCCWRALLPAPLRALPCAFLREPRVSERNFLSPSLLAVRGSRRVFSVRGSQLSHCAPARPIQAVLFLPALSLRGRKQTRQRSEAPVHTCAGGRCQALLHLPNSHRSNSVTPPERHLVPRAPRGALPPGSPLLPMRNLMQTHFDHGFLAGLDLPTERF